MPSGVDLTWVWVIGLISLAVGIGLGAGVAYLALGSFRRARELKTKLDALQQEHDAYRDQVAQHFLKTSQLVQRMTDSYRDVYKHLAASSQSLCKEPLATPRLDFAENTSIASKAKHRIAENRTRVGFSNGETDELEDTDPEAYLGDSPRVPDLNRDGLDSGAGSRRRKPPS